MAQNEQQPTLEDVISLYNLKELNSWIRKLNLNISSKLRKAEKVHLLAQNLRKSPTIIVKYLPTYNLQMFLDIIDGKISSHSYDIYEDLFFFETYGMAYCTKQKDWMPEFIPELIDIYKPAIEAEIEHRRTSGILEVEKRIYGLTNIYGIISSTEFNKIFEESECFRKASEDKDKLLFEMLILLSPVFQYDCKDFQIFSPFFIEGIDLCNDYGTKEFDDDFICGMGEMPLMQFNMPSAKHLVSVLKSKGVAESEIGLTLMQLWWHHIAESPMKSTIDIIGRLSPDIHTFEAIYSAATDFINNVPMWKFNGFSSQEAFEMEQKKEPKRNIIGYAPSPIIVGKKPGRNDPCPCGSGKKYKHCCGR